MESFPTNDQPDEGYSEEPINSGPVKDDLAVALSSLPSRANIGPWLAQNAWLLPLHVREDLTMALLEGLPTSSVAEIVQHLHPRLYIDFVRHLPAEICLKILSYLEPASLVNVMQTCRAWNDLALDRKLWERLYHLEGWKAVHKEIEWQEEKINLGLSNSRERLQRIQAAFEEGEPSMKRRALSNEEHDDVDNDTAMTSQTDETSNTPLPHRTLFGDAHQRLTADHSVTAPTREMDIDLVASASSKGKQADRTPTRLNSTGKRKEPSDKFSPTDSPLVSEPSAGVGKPPLWTWDAASSRYRIDWKYLYNMRQKLESNWELGKFTTFQLPHPHFPEEGHTDCVYTLQFSQDYVVTGSRDHTIRIWSMKTKRLIRPPLTSHTGSVLCLQFDADPEEDLLISGSSDSNVLIWKFSTGELVQKMDRAHHEAVLNVRFDKRVLVTASKDKSIKIFNRHPLRYGDVGYGHVDLAVDPTAIKVKRYGFDVDLANELPVKPAWSEIGVLLGHRAAVNAIQVRGDTVVSISGDRQIRIWDWPQQLCTQNISAHDKGIACVEYDGRRIASGSSDYKVCIFDAATGLKVASLRGHSSLVRTVQMGFGDLPYSQSEDEAEARAVDQRYFKAVRDGEVNHDEDLRTRRRRRRNSGGSSNPVDIDAVGAKLPPGGGGGRRYGRIVSGSYDQSVIIWRRDKEGVWKPAHHLRPEEVNPAGPMRGHTGHQDVRQIHGHSAAQPPALNGAPPADPIAPNTSPQPRLHTHPPGPRSTAFYRALIDQVLPHGGPGLQQALARYPGLLQHDQLLHSSIASQPSPILRAQLRQVVLDAVAMPETHRSLTSPPRAVAEGSIAASTARATAGSDTDEDGAAEADPHRAVPATLPAETGASHAQQAAPPPPPPLPPHHPHGQAHGDGDLPNHPMWAPRVPVGKRIFKLQFDARKIIACCQAPVVVGWDFCNGDKDLEEVARFFATVD